MSGHQTATIADTVYFWFGANDTSGSGGDGATALYDVREAGAAASAIPLLSGSPTLLSHANYPAGCYEISIAATTGNGFAANDTFAVFCTLAIDSQNPTGFVGSCTLTPLAKVSDITALNDLSAAQVNAECDTALTDYDGPTNAEMNARTLVAASYFDPAADAVANVTLVATTTTNTDMVGTDSAMLASSAPTNFGDLSITATTGRVDVAAVAGTAQTANDNGADINAILADTADIQPNYATSASIAALNDIAATEIVSAGAITTLSGAVVNVDTVDTTTTNTDMVTEPPTAAQNRAEMDSNSTRLATLSGGIIEGATSGTPTTTSTNTDLTGYVTGELDGRLIVFTGGTANGQAVTISTYTSTNGVVTFAALTTAPAASDPFKIV